MSDCSAHVSVQMQEDVAGMQKINAKPTLSCEVVVNPFEWSAPCTLRHGFEPNPQAGAMLRASRRNASKIKIGTSLATQVAGLTLDYFGLLPLQFGVGLLVTTVAYVSQHGQPASEHAKHITSCTLLTSWLPSRNSQG